MTGMPILFLLLSVLVCLSWVFYNPGFPSLVAFFAALAALLVFVSKRGRVRKSQKQNAKSSVAVQSGRDSNINIKK